MKDKLLSCAVITAMLLSPGVALAKGARAAKKAAVASASSTAIATNNSIAATSTKANYSQTISTQKGVTTINATYSNANGQTVSDAATVVQASNGDISRNILIQKPNGNEVKENEILTPNADCTYNVTGTATKNYGDVHQYYNTQTINEKEVALPNAATSLAANDSTVHSRFTGVAGNSSGSYSGYNSANSNRASNNNNTTSNSFNNEPEAATIYNQTLAESGASSSSTVYNTGD